MNFTLSSNKYAAINALKASIAVVIAYLLGSIVGNILAIQRMYLWIVVTVLVVMSTQPNLGGALDKALMRFLGGAVGAIIAILVLVLAKNNLSQIISILPFIFLAVYFAGASSKYSYAGTLAGITLVIIILNQQPSVETAIYRAIEISSGVAISLMVNRFVIPIRAETRLKQSYSKTILQIHNFFDVLFIERNNYHEKLRETIFGEFAKYTTLIKELKYERSAKKVHEFEKMGLYIRRLYRYMIIMYEYIETSVDTKTTTQLDKNPVFIEFKKYIMKSLKDVSNDIKKRKRISCKELLCFEKHILPILKDVGILNNKDEIFTFCIKMFLDALKKLSLEYNYILQISKY